MTRWQKLGLIGLAAGVFLLLLIVIFGRLSRTGSSSASADPWNSHAIESTFAGVRVKEIDATHASILFFYDLDNKTSTDYHLASGSDVVIMSRLTPGGSLVSNSEIGLDADAFVPAKNRTRITIKAGRPFEWPKAKDVAAENRFRELVAGPVAGVEEFVIFDRAARYQITLPTPSAEPQQGLTVSGQN